MERLLLPEQQVDCPLEHFFAPGVYVRQITMPTGSIVVGHMHKTAHLNTIVRGRALVSQNGVVREMRAPMTFLSEPGVRKALIIFDHMVWQTIHVTEISEIPSTPEEVSAVVDRLEPDIIEKSDEWISRHGKTLRSEMQNLIKEAK